MTLANSLDPRIPVDPRHARAQALADDFREVYTRLEQLEKTRTKVSFGDGVPAQPIAGLEPPLGTIYVDQTNSHIWLWDGSLWVSSDLYRNYSAMTGTISATSTSYTDLGGPSVTVPVPAAGGFVLLYCEAELKPGLSGTTYSSASVAIHEDTDFPTVSVQLMTEVQATGTPTFVRHVSTAGGYGDKYPTGSWIAFKTSAGPTSRTYQMRYATEVSGIAAQYKNRKLWVVVL